MSEAEDIRRAMTVTEDPTWVLQRNGRDARDERDAEARLCLGNGFLSMRGAPDLGRGPPWISVTPSLTVLSWPRCWVAGLWDVPELEPRVPVPMPAPDWSRVSLSANGAVLRDGETTRWLDLRRGVLVTRAVWPECEAWSLRLVSRDDPALALQVLWISARQDGIVLGLEAWCDTAHAALAPVSLAHDLGHWRTPCSGIDLAIAADAQAWANGAPLATVEAGALRWAWRWAGGTACFVRRVAVARGAHAAAQARTTLHRAPGWRGLLSRHEFAWANLWDNAEIAIEGDPQAHGALRFATFHLLAAANPADPTVSIGARGLTGDGYLGHVFWDTEIYMLPFYTLAWPQAARTLLAYRHATLPGARRNAAAAGHPGAMFAWESAATGDEATPDHVLDRDGNPALVLTGKQEQHITADIAHAIWRHWEASADEEFLHRIGAEILIETSRFWAARAVPEADGMRHVRRVIGPDEYHESIDDNAFTNLMAAANLRRAAETTRWLLQRIPETAAKLSATAAEADDWDNAASAIATGFHPENGLFEQFAGYFEAAATDPRGPLHIKQADVVALLALLPTSASREDAQRNYTFYEPRCRHESSLSHPMHALLAARLGDAAAALRHFQAAAALDLSAAPGADAAGVHMAAIGGLWQAALLGFGGVSWEGGTLALAPCLPGSWTALSFRLHFQGRRLALRITHGEIAINLLSGDALALSVQGQAHTIRPGYGVIATFSTPSRWWPNRS